ncbi:Adenylate cyclase [Diplonema papillatum]|nr:Adenylate cyclase [Diplonema papillatum]
MKRLRELVERGFQRIETPGESEASRIKKRVWLTFLVTEFLLAAIFLPVLHRQWPWRVSLGIGAVCSLVGIAVIVTRRCVPNLLLVWLLICMCISIAAADWGAAALGHDRWWPLFVIILDILLVSRERNKAAFVAYVAVLWLGVIAAEQSFRLGLLDARFFFPDHDTRSCSNPPCASVRRLLVAFPCQVFIFLLDFALTRWFSDQVLSEKARMEASVQAANAIASALAAFDLPGARDSLNTATAGNLPPELADALEKLLRNLTAYRPYLPDALFDQDDPEFQRSAPSVTAPGLDVSRTAEDKSVATIVFTDIVQSTAIWNACPEEMKRALQVHNAVIRSLLVQFRGYEVKTIGDSFMAAFESSGDAVKFALSVHVKLYNACWPLPILAVPHCSVVPRAWRGLRVRIGIHRGPVAIEKNTVIDRFDYFGPTVNLAARLEANCQPGCVAAMPELVDEVERRWTLMAPATHQTLRLDSIRQQTYSIRQQTLRSKSAELMFVDLDEWRTAVAARSKVAELKGIGKRNIVVFAPLTLRARLEAPSSSRGSRGDDDDIWETHTVSSPVSFEEPPRHPGIWGLESVPSATFASLTLDGLDHKAPIAVFQEAVDDALVIAVQAINKTEGNLVTVLGNTVFASWNASRRVLGHFQCSVHFSRLVDRAMPGRSRTQISTGSVFAGTVGTEGQRVITVFGGCVGLAFTVDTSDVNVRAVYCPHASQVIEGVSGIGAPCGLPQKSGIVC